MNKKTIAIIVIVLIVVLLLVFFLIRANNKGTSIVLPGGTNNVGETATQNSKFEDFNISIPDGYTVINEDQITSTHSMYVKAVAYKYDEEGKRTNVNVYLQNRGEKEFSKDAVCLISFYDSLDLLILRTSGVIEEGVNIPVGGTTVVKTQFYDKPGNVAKIGIDFENVDGSTTQELNEAESDEEGESEGLPEVLSGELAE